MSAVEFVFVMVRGIAARVWRVLGSRPCPCEHCVGHRAFIAETEAMYRAAVLRNPHPVVVDDEGDVYRPAPPPVGLPTRAYLSTLHEARRRRGL